MRRWMLTSSALRLSRPNAIGRSQGAPPAMPASLYDSAKVFVQLVSPIVLCDLDDVSVRTQLSKAPAVAAAMAACEVSN